MPYTTSKLRPRPAPPIKRVKSAAPATPSTQQPVILQPVVQTPPIKRVAITEPKPVLKAKAFQPRWNISDDVIHRLLMGRPLSISGRYSHRRGYSHQQRFQRADDPKWLSFLVPGLVAAAIVVTAMANAPGLVRWVQSATGHWAARQ